VAAARQGRIAARDRSRARRALDQFWGDLDVWEVVQPIVERAGDLAEQLALRGYDAVHLATALAALDPRGAGVQAARPRHPQLSGAGAGPTHRRPKDETPTPRTLPFNGRDRSQQPPTLDEPP
jgi:hypothetical protein